MVDMKGQRSGCPTSNARSLAQQGRAVQIRRTARLSQKLDASAVVLHDAHDEASNLWGAFDRARRNLPRIRLHFACKGL